MKVVLDTNVLISATFWNGDSNKILNLINDEKLEFIISQEILKEYYNVLSREDIIEKIIDKNLIDSRIVKKAIHLATTVYPKMTLDIVKDDSSDNKIIECAIAGNAKYIITNDSHLLKIKKYKNIIIVTPFSFLSIINL